MHGSQPETVGESQNANRSDERLRLVLQATRAGIWDTHLGTGDTYVSERFEEIMGYLPGSCPRSITAFVRQVVPSHRERVLDHMRESVRTGQPFVTDCRIVGANAAERWLNVRGDVLTDEHGRATRVFGTVVDITEEANARFAREEQDRFVAGVNAALPVVVYVYDALDHRLQFVNRAFGEMLGYSDAEQAQFAANGLSSILHPDDAVAASASLSRIADLREGEVETLLVRLRHQDGTFRSMRARTIPLRFTPAGDLWQILGTAEDISEQVRADKRLRDGERELARAQEIARVGSWTWNFESETLSWSREYYRIAGLDPEHVTPSTAALEPLIPPADLDRLRDAHLACISGGPSVDERYTLRRPDGELRHVHGLTELQRGPAGEPLALVGTMQDITEQVEHEAERARLETQVHHAQKMESLGLLAGGIAHDFNNLLVGVLSNASLALLDIDEQAPIRDVVLDIERTAQRAAELTRQLLAYSGKGRFVVEPISLGALANEMAQLLRTVVSKDAELIIDTADGDALIKGDATQLRQVIMNLITNASDALEGKAGTVTVRTSLGLAEEPTADALHYGELPASTPVAVLEVSDTGSGMSPEIAARIFDPFFSTKFTGRGLGLAATLGIVRGHHGRISVHSELNTGTRFAMAFPITADVISPTSTEVPATAEPERGRVLVVDDDSVVRSVTTALLSRRGFHVDSVADGQTALDRIGSAVLSYRFVLLDLTMPGLSGIDVLQRIRQDEAVNQRPALPVCLMSGYTAHDVSGEVGSLVTSGFLQKPFTLADLDELLAGLRNG